MGTYVCTLLIHLHCTVFVLQMITQVAFWYCQFHYQRQQLTHSTLFSKQDTDVDFTHHSHDDGRIKIKRSNWKTQNIITQFVFILWNNWATEADSPWGVGAASCGHTVVRRLHAGMEVVSVHGSVQRYMGPSSGLQEHHHYLSPRKQTDDVSLRVR